MKYMGIVGALLVVFALSCLGIVVTQHIKAESELRFSKVLKSEPLRAEPEPEPFEKPNSPPESLEHLLLSRICVSESNWIQHSGSNTNDCGGILLVLRRRAELNGWSLVEAMRRYSPRATGVLPARSPRGIWVASLNLDATTPEGWPRQLAWYPPVPRRFILFIRKWKARLDEATKLLNDPRLEEICEGPVDHWGGQMDDHRAVAEGWIRVRCGRTHNHFWMVPRLNRGRTVPADAARGRYRARRTSHHAAIPTPASANTGTNQD